jgi:putative membrane protein
MMLEFGLIHWLLMLVFWGALVSLALWLVKALFPGGTGGTASSSDRPLSPREILDQRYARGEITREQYLQMRRDLEEE